MKIYSSIVDGEMWEAILYKTFPTKFACEGMMHSKITKSCAYSEKELVTTLIAGAASGQTWKWLVFELPPNKTKYKYVAYRDVCLLIENYSEEK